MSEQLIQLHRVCLELAEHPLEQRLHVLCKHFLGVGFGAWRDGTSLESPDDFNYDLKTLDCVTFVEVILALAKTRPSNDFTIFAKEFETILRSLHYVGGTPTYMMRNHFMCCDWIPNNKFMVEDITRSICQNYKMAATVIDKLTWMQRRPIMAIEQLSAEQVQRLAPVASHIPYIESMDFLDNTQHYINAFPEYSIINIVRPDWDLTDRIGTHLNISHLGLVFKDHMKNDLLFYHATIDRQMVVQETLPGYIRRFLDTPSVGGFDVLAISPGYQHAG